VKDMVLSGLTPCGKSKSHCLQKQNQAYILESAQVLSDVSCSGCQLPGGAVSSEHITYSQASSVPWVVNCWAVSESTNTCRQSAQVPEKSNTSKYISI
jgi:hypothetical protein